MFPARYTSVPLAESAAASAKSATRGPSTLGSPVTRRFPASNGTPISAPSLRLNTSQSPIIPSGRTAERSSRVNALAFTDPTATTFADRPPVPLSLSKRIVVPSASIFGATCDSPVALSGRVSCTGEPPPDGTLRSPAPRAPVAPPTMMSPFGAQLAPLAAGISAMSVAGPPSTGIFCSFPSAKKASHFPSGEKNGCVAFSVPGMGRDSNSPIARMSSRLPLPIAARYTTYRPSGETAGSGSASDGPSSGSRAMLKRTGELGGAAARPRAPHATATMPATASTPSTMVLRRMRVELTAGARDRAAMVASVVGTPVGVSATLSSIRSTSVAWAGRSAACFSRHCITNEPRIGGTLGRRRSIDSGASLTWAASNA